MFFCSSSLSQENLKSSTEFIVAGKGWGVVSINSDRKEIEKVLGKGKNSSVYDDVYFIDYPKKGIQISYENETNKAYAIFFYNKERWYEDFETPDIKTDKGISWASSPKEVIEAYGKPKNHYKDNGDGSIWQRIVFEGIDFRFENNKMVRIGIPGR